MIYFSGCDEFNSVPLTSEQDANTPRQIDSFYCNIAPKFDLVVYKKDLKSGWFVRGFGTRGILIELFESRLNILQVSFTASSAFGLSENGSVYKAEFQIVNEDDYEEAELKWTIDLVWDAPEKEERIKMIATNDSDCFAIGNLSRIYKLPDLIYKIDRTPSKISCGFEHCLVLTGTGGVYSFGIGTRGQLGHENVGLNPEKPRRIEFFDDLPSIVKDISCGGYHSLALTSDGDCYSWGWNESGQNGYSLDKLSSVSGQPYPIDLGSSRDPIISIASGARHSVALLASGKAYGWGHNKFGQLGLGGSGESASKPEPTLISFFSDNNLKVNRVICGRCSTFFFCK